jgi:hypothetical protein
MKKIIFSFLLLARFFALVSCKKYFDVNSDPASPQQPNLSALLPPVYSLIPAASYLDGRFSGTYLQNFTSTTNDGFDFHGGNGGGETGIMLVLLMRYVHGDFNKQPIILVKHHFMMLGRYLKIQ